MIGILTDSIIANIPLMKIARYYTNVEWYLPLMHTHYDKIFYSKIFDFTPLVDRQDEMVVGGTGHEIKKRLPDDIEKCQPDYSIYPNCDYSLQYFSRGCIRKCGFCVVPEKEGGIHPVEAMQLNPNGKYIRILDNNFFANPLWRDAIVALQKINQPVMFDSGLDVRIFDEDQGRALQSIKIHKRVHIAWDNPRQDLIAKIKLMTRFVKAYKITAYILIGYDSSPEQDMERVVKIRELGADPFVMPYNKKDQYQKRFARWVNHKAVFKSVKWEDYGVK